MSEREDDFLGRWSRRKVEARGGGLKKRQDAPETPADKPGRMRTEPLPPKTETLVVDEDAPGSDELLVQDAALREDLDEDQVPAPVEDDEAPADAGDGNEDAAESEPEDLEKIDFDSLDYDSDYTKFMKSGVPESVRKRALRMLWGSNPILANVDGLNDYDEDFTDAALAVKGLLKSSYKPGSGYLTDEEREASYSEEAKKAGVKPKEEDETGDKIAKDDAETDDVEGEEQIADIDESKTDQPDKGDDGNADTAMSEDAAPPDEHETGPDDDVSGKADDTA